MAGRRKALALVVGGREVLALVMVDKIFLAYSGWMGNPSERVEETAVA